MAENFYTGAKPIEPEDIKTVPFDARFPYTNQSKNCWQNYVDFYKCIKIKVRFYGRVWAGERERMRPSPPRHSSRLLPSIGRGLQALLPVPQGIPVAVPQGMGKLL
jgi:hypothetical protein